MFILELDNIEITEIEGLLFSLVAMAIVFTILFLLVFLVSLLSKIKFKEEVKAPVVAKKPSTVAKKLTMDDIKDDDMMLAALVATAEFVEETKEKDARLVSIKQIG